MCREDRYRLIHILPFLDHGLVACDVDMSSSKPTAVTGMLAIAHARGLFEESMGRWFGSGGQTNTEYEDLVLFVDATTRSYTLRLKKGALGPNPGSRAISEGLVELLRKRLVEEEEALLPSDWDRIAKYMSEALEKEASKARSSLLARLADVSARIPADDGGGGSGNGETSGAHVVAKACAQLRGAVGGVKVKIDARLEAAEEALLAEMAGGLEIAREELGRIEEVLAKSREWEKCSAEAEDAGREIISLLDATIQSCSSREHGPPNGFDPRGELSKAMGDLDVQEACESCRVMQLGGGAQDLAIPPTPHRPLASDESPSAPAALVDSGGTHLSRASEARAGVAGNVSGETSELLPPEQMVASGEKLVGADAADAGMHVPLLPPPPGSRRGAMMGVAREAPNSGGKEGAGGGEAPLIDLSSPRGDVGGAVWPAGSARVGAQVKSGGAGGESLIGGMEDLEMALDALGGGDAEAAGEDGGGGKGPVPVVDLDDLLASVGDSF